MFRALPPIIRFVDLDFARELIERAALSCKPETLKHEPSRLLGNLEILVKLVRTNPVFAINEKPCRRKPFLKRNRRVLKDGARLQRERGRRVIGVALPNAALRKPRDVGRSAYCTSNFAVRPAKLHHEAAAVLEIGEVEDRFLKAPLAVHGSSMRQTVGDVKYILKWCKYTSLTEGGRLDQGDRRDSGEYPARLHGMLIAYGDDSSDKKKSTVFSVAVVLGSRAQWRHFKPLWEKRNGSIPFHATDCESGWGDYRGIDREARTSLYRDLVGMLADSNLFAFSSAVNVAHFRQMFPTNETFEMPYYICFADVIANCAALGSIMIPAQKIDLTFDQNFERDPSTSDLYAYLGSLKDWSVHGHLGERITFANYRNESGIQVADLLARETMKHMENTMLIPRERWSRASWVRLRRNPRIHIRFVDRDELVATVSGFPSGMGEMSDYKTWRSEHGITSDNLTNRLKYLRWCDSERDIQSKQEAIKEFDDDLET
jgi:hypothetical protein